MKNVLCLLFLAAMFGCSSGGAPPQTELKYPQWEAMDKLSSDDVREIVMGAEAGDWQTVKKAASSPDFKAAVDAFASTDVPEEFATDARKQLKEDAVKKFRALIEAASGSGSVQEHYEAAYESLKAVRAPDPVE
jgi:hypothetical protein